MTSSGGKNKGYIISDTPNKVIIRYGEVHRALNKEEVKQLNDLILKIRRFDGGGIPKIRNNSGRY